MNNRYNIHGDRRDDYKEFGVITKYHVSMEYARLAMQRIGYEDPHRTTKSRELHKDFYHIGEELANKLIPEGIIDAPCSFDDYSDKHIAPEVV